MACLYLPWLYHHGCIHDGCAPRSDAPLPTTPTPVRYLPPQAERAEKRALAQERDALKEQARSLVITP